VIGRSRGGLTTKTHAALVDGRGLPLVIALTPGQAVVERAFNHLKNWRGLATRYDKHALVYRGGVVLASILLWLS
jgi:transposase